MDDVRRIVKARSSGIAVAAVAGVACVPGVDFFDVTDKVFVRAIQHEPTIVITAQIDRPLQVRARQCHSSRIAWIDNGYHVNLVSVLLVVVGYWLLELCFQPIQIWFPVGVGRTHQQSFLGQCQLQGHDMIEIIRCKHHSLVLVLRGVVVVVFVFTFTQQCQDAISIRLIGPDCDHDVVIRQTVFMAEFVFKSLAQIGQSFVGSVSVQDLCGLVL